ncbi:RNA polymerase sigma factor [Pseudonocardia sp. RS010]|uniref:RNA polymerase sigma factor n=1 Tax=Pseudonocardia sp. RS010 TaxID=3385979 RepID=UPI0039A0FE35
MPPTTEVEEFSNFYREHYRNLYWVCWRSCRGDERLAEDIVQDTFANLYRSYASGTPAWKVLSRGYAMKALSHRTIDHFRRAASERKMITTVESWPPIDNDLTRDPGEKVAEHASVVWQLKDLTKRQQEVLYFRFVGMSMSEVAEMLDIGLGTAYGYYKAGLRRLQQIHSRT